MHDLQIDEVTRGEIDRLEDWSKSVTVKTPEERTSISEALKSLKGTRGKIVEFFREMKEAAWNAHKSIVAKEKSYTDKIDSFETAAKRSMGEYDREVARKAEEERKRLQAIADEQARREREKAEAEARRQREIAEEARRKAEEARRKAEAEAKDQADRERLLRAVEAAERKAAAADVKAEANIETAGAVIAPVVQVAEPTKREGESKRMVWKARITDIAKIPQNYYIADPKVVAAIQSALDNFARATKGAVPVNGVQFYGDETIAIRSR